MTALMLSAVGVPLLGAALVPWLRAARALRLLLPAAVLPALSLALVSNGGEVLALPYLFQGAAWSLDGPRRVFLLATALLWLAAGIHAAGYIARERLRGLGLFWLLALAGNLGLILSRDVPGFYSFFALMTFAAYGLVVHDGTVESRYAGRIYLIMALLGEMLLLAGLLLACRAAGSLMLADLPGAVPVSGNGAAAASLLWLGFGVKAGLPLLHFWLPLAHPVAPAPASAVLSGAMIKAGLLGWLLVLPLGETVPAQWSQIVAAAGGAAALGGAALGLCQRLPKAMLAYSSISQMGLITILLGAALGDPARASTLAAVIALYALHHALAKGALFLSAGLNLPAGPGPRLCVWLLVALPALSLAGLPFTSGAVAKLLAKSALPAAPGWGLILSAAALATTLLVARFLHCLAGHLHAGANPAGVVPGWLLAAGLSVLGAWWMPPWAGVEGVSVLPAPATLWSLLWPLFAGGVIAGAMGWAGWRPPAVPPGDGIVWAAALGRRVSGSARRAVLQVRSACGSAVDAAPWLRRWAGLQRAVRTGDDAMRREAGFLFLVLGALAALALLW